MSQVDRILHPVLTPGLEWLGRRRQPVHDGIVYVPDLAAPVEVLRDKWGVPHIYAQAGHDLMFAQGYVHGQDRLWQMDFQRRLVAGRLAEVLGAAGLDVDRWMRIIGMRRVAEQEVDLLNAAVRAELDAYAAGVNAAIRREPKPIEFTLLGYTPEPWTIADTISWVKMMSWSLSVNWETELLRAQLIAHLGPEAAAELEIPYLDHLPCIVPRAAGGADDGRTAQERADAARPFIGPPASGGLGSNNWVISGSRTVSGKPILANDMHLLISSPAIWYENHLLDGECNISGVTFPGIPGVVAGHNSYVAWGFTNGFPDVQDLYIEHLRRTDDGRVQYEFRGAWHDAQVYQEEIRVKGAPGVVQEVIVTCHGPIINQNGNTLGHEEPLALRWTSLEPDTMMHAMRGFNCAQSCLELREAFRHWTGPVQNVVYADIEGNIGYSFAGRVPIRAQGNGQVPVPGWTGEFEWVGYVPYDEQPHLYNPPQGYIVTANNRVTPDESPYYLGREFCISDRAERIVELIEAREKLDVEYMQCMHFDQVSVTARVLAECIGRLHSDEPDLAAVIEMMRHWNGELKASSPEAALHEVFLRQMLTTLLAEKLGALTERYMGKGPVPIVAQASLFGQRAMEWLQHVLSDDSRDDRLQLQPFLPAERLDEIMCKVLRESISFLAERFGPAPAGWEWGKLHTLNFNHLLGRVPMLAPVLNRGPYPIGGDSTTVWATGASYHDLTSENVVSAPFRFIVDLGDLTQSLGLLGPGQSGRPGSVHYDDQIVAWFDGNYHPMLSRRADVEKHTEAVLRLLPRI